MVIFNKGAIGTVKEFYCNEFWTENDKEMSYVEERGINHLQARKDEEDEEELQAVCDLGFDLLLTRSERRMSQKELAEKLGLSISTIARLEKAFLLNPKETGDISKKRTQSIV